MGLVRGQNDYRRWNRGNRLTRQEAIEAQCYVCNGGENDYCGGAESCTLYAYSQFNREALRKRVEKAENRLSKENSAILSPMVGVKMDMAPQEGL